MTPHGSARPFREATLSAWQLRNRRWVRTLPRRVLPLTGSWCFLDHFGPGDVAESGGMVVPRHRHTGLATGTWRFTGAVAHLDSTGY